MASNSQVEEPAGRKGVEVDSLNEDATHGFTRPEMNKKPLVGSVDLYERHVFLCYGDPKTWPSKVEAADYDPLPSKLQNAMRSKKNELAKKTRLTIAEGQDEPEKTNGDILIFPDMVKYKIRRGIFRRGSAGQGEMWALGKPVPMVGSHVFICGHGSRDKRCGVCGPPLKERFIQEFTNRGLDGQVSVRFCSHVGGHKFAGNVIVFRHEDSGEVSGHWYGYVTPEDVPEILEKHIGLGQVVDRLWRGQMGLTEGQQKKDQQKRIADKSAGERDPEESEHKKQEMKTDATATPDGAPPPARRKLPPVLLPRIGSRDLHQMCGDEEPEEEGPLRPYEEKKPRFKWPAWIEDWELMDTATVLGVAGAAVLVYVAYNTYRAAQHHN